MTATILFALLWLQAGSSSGEIRGSVTDHSGAAIPSATVLLTSRSTRQTLSLTTEDNGAYRALSLRPDTYEVRIVLPGLEASPQVLELTVGQTAALDFKMNVATLHEGLDVVAVKGLLAEPERTQQSNTIEGEALRQLPIDKRNYLTYSLLMPGVADADALADANDYRPPQAAHSGLSFYGNNGRGNAVSVD